MSARVLLLRHPPVATAWAGRCYGRSDMGLSRAGQAMAARLVEQLATEPIDLVVHSGANRTKPLAKRVAARVGSEIREDRRWWERDFGAWEGRSWNAIWRETGNLMDPHGFRPGGGETGAELAARSAEAWTDVRDRGTVLIVAHGGSLAAVLTGLYRSALEEMARYIPQTGVVLRIDTTEAMPSAAAK